MLRRSPASAARAIVPGLPAVVLVLALVACGAEPPPPVAAVAGGSGAEPGAAPAEDPRAAGTRETLAGIRRWLVERARRGEAFPPSLREAPTEGRTETRDGWGNEVRMEPEMDVESGEVTSFVLRSAGPDGRFGNADDVLDTPAEVR